MEREFQVRPWRMSRTMTCQKTISSDELQCQWQNWSHRTSYSASGRTIVKGRKIIGCQVFFFFLPQDNIVGTKSVEKTRVGQIQMTPAPILVSCYCTTTGPTAFLPQKDPPPMTMWYMPDSLRNVTQKKENTKSVSKVDFSELFLLLLWIKKARAKDKTYIWGSVRWKTEKLKLRNLHTSHTLGCAIPAVIHT